MSTMTVVSDVLGSVGASDAAISAMGPTLTIVFSYIAGFAVAQTIKFPLAKLLSHDWHGYVVRIVGVMTAFSFSHFLSDHLSVPLEVLVGVTQPITYEVAKRTAARFLPWLAPLFRSVGDKP